MSMSHSWQSQGGLQIQVMSITCALKNWSVVIIQRYTRLNGPVYVSYPHTPSHVLPTKIRAR